MRPTTFYVIASTLFALVFVAHVAAQSETFTDDNVAYKLELPSSTWRVVSRPDGLQQRAEIVYGDRMDGYLQIHKETVETGVSASDLATSYSEDKLRFKPGYVDGKEENFAGHLNGVTASYEYTYAGKLMVGRIYYLQADARTIYVLHFTGLRDKLARVRNQTDGIARSFELK